MPSCFETLAPLGLTRRETAVLLLLAQGISTADIATQLAVAPATVRKHVEHIHRKIGVHTSLAAVAEAVRMLRDEGKL